MTGTAPRWGRAHGHRIQHAWMAYTAHPVATAVCRHPNDRRMSTIDFTSDAARCERCAARLNLTHVPAR